jgi:hypothetical protein
LASKKPAYFVLVHDWIGFIAAVTFALGEMAGTLLSVRRIHQGMLDLTPDQILVSVELESATEAMLFLLFPRATARTLAQRIL